LIIIVEVLFITGRTGLKSCRSRRRYSFIEVYAGGFGLHKKDKQQPVSFLIIDSLCGAVIYLFCAVAGLQYFERITF
jgi:hypothetical protein